MRQVGSDLADGTAEARLTWKEIIIDVRSGGLWSASVDVLVQVDFEAVVVPLTADTVVPLRLRGQSMEIVEHHALIGDPWDGPEISIYYRR